MKTKTCCEYAMKEAFEAVCEVSLMDKEHAARTLRSVRRKNYMSAYRDGEAYVLKKVSVICPNCGMHLHYYAARTDSFIERKLMEFQIDMAVADYLDDQISFFENPNRDYVSINTPLPCGTEIECWRCGTHGILKERSSERKVRIQNEQEKLCISCDIHDIFEALSIGWVTILEKDVAIGRPPYEERIIFDFESSVATIQLVDGSGVACEKELTSEAELVGHDPIGEVFRNFVLRRRIRKAFLEAYGDTVYFTADEMNLDRYILQTKFIGYYRDFYDGIPFMEFESSVLGERRLPNSIRDIAGKMHRASDVSTLYKSLGLPAAKSVRKIVFKDPQLLFYANELKILHDVFSDLNYYRRILSCASIYRILAELVRCGKARDYLVMLREVMGMRWLFEHIKDKDCTDMKRPLSSRQ